MSRIHPCPSILQDSPIVGAGLHAKHLTGKAIVKFIMVSANNIINHKSYPTKEEKEHIARQCIRTFPFLEASCGSEYVSVIYNFLLVSSI